MKELRINITKKHLVCVVLILVCLAIIVAIFLWRSKEQSHPDLWETVDNPVTNFPAQTVIIQTHDEVYWIADYSIHNFQSWVAGFSTTGESNLNIKDDWTYRIMFTDASIENCDISDEAIKIPHTGDLHYIYINCEQHIIQVDNISYILKQAHRETLYNIVARKCKYARENGYYIKPNS